MFIRTPDFFSYHSNPNLIIQDAIKHSKEKKKPVVFEMGKNCFYKVDYTMNDDYNYICENIEDYRLKGLL